MPPLATWMVTMSQRHRDDSVYVWHTTLSWDMNLSYRSYAECRVGVTWAPSEITCEDCEAVSQPFATICRVSRRGLIETDPESWEIMGDILLISGHWTGRAEISLVNSSPSLMFRLNCKPSNNSSCSEFPWKDQRNKYLRELRGSVMMLWLRRQKRRKQKTQDIIC